MSDELIFENVIESRTPVGYFAVMDGEKRVPFSVTKNWYDCPVDVYDDSNNNVIDHICTEHDYAIIIDGKRLEPGKEIVIRFFADVDCEWEWCDAGENRDCYRTIIGNLMVGIGGYDFNEMEKVRQAEIYSEKMGYLVQHAIISPPAYDESTFQEYIIEPLDDCDGYRFRMIEPRKVEFLVAWVSMDKHPVIEYENALGLWLS